MKTYLSGNLRALVARRGGVQYTPDIRDSQSVFVIKGARYIGGIFRTGWKKYGLIYLHDTGVRYIGISLRQGSYFRPRYPVFNTQ